MYDCSAFETSPSPSDPCDGKEGGAFWGPNGGPALSFLVMEQGSWPPPPRGVPLGVRGDELGGISPLSIACNSAKKPFHLSSLADILIGEKLLIDHTTKIMGMSAPKLRD